MSTLEAFSLPIQSITNIDFGRRRLTTGPAYMDGRLDETVIYKRLLNADERGWLYNSGNGRTYSDLGAGTTYTYNASHKHAVASLSTGETYSYDANGNTPALHQTQCGARVTQRVEGGQTYTQTFDAENRLISVTVSGQTTQFIYNGDGNLIKKINPNGSKTLYVGGIYEVDKASGGSVTRTVTYYPVGGAMRINNTLYYILKDHLGSASVVTDASGVEVGEQRYYPFGETRLTTGTIYTDKLYTGQREMAGLGIYHYQARFYSPKIGRFLSADTITPNPANPQNFNRYSYVTNNPLRYIDPTGHYPCGPDNIYCGGSAENDYYSRPSSESQNIKIGALKHRIKKSNRSDFEKTALQNLLTAGAEGLHVVDYVVSNNVTIDFRWHPYAGGYWDDEDNAVYLNRYLNVPNAANDPFVLGTIAHEAMHLEQGHDLALSKVGELDAWKVGIMVESYFRPLQENTIRYKIANNLQANDIATFTELVHEYNNHVSGGWIYNFLFDLLPDIPSDWVSSGR